MQDDPLHRPPTYQWPKYALAGVLLFVALAVLWLLREVNRIQQQKQRRQPVPTNAAPPRAQSPAPDGAPTISGPAYLEHRGTPSLCPLPRGDGERTGLPNRAHPA